MAISLYKLKKWTKMVLGKSSYHVNQDEGKIYSVHGVEGYYNNLTEKITRFAVPKDLIPITVHDNGAVEYFSIAIFQYGLAAYDLWLLTNDISMLKKFNNCVEWAINNQLISGAWITFATQNIEQPYSAMAQGEGISLMVRAYKLTNNLKYLESAHRAMLFMLTPREKGGVCEYIGDDLFLYEFTYLPCVLNGWIFAAWGLFDYYKTTKDSYVKSMWERTIQTLAKNLSTYDAGYWSYYNDMKALASPFYHNLHIAQLKVLYELTNINEFKSTAMLWEKYNKSFLNRMKAFSKKALQKILE